MKATHTRIADLVLIQPKVYEDDRGFFLESFNHKQFENIIGHKINFVQDNHSHSKQGVLRGLHYQLPPMAQGKLIRVVQGEIFDVAVDIRTESPTFGQYEAVYLSAQNKCQFWIPPGFAHGFLALSPQAEILYKTTNYWSKAHERTIRYDDRALNIRWPYDITIVSEKDKLGLTLEQVELFCSD